MLQARGCCDHADCSRPDDRLIKLSVLAFYRRFFLPGHYLWTLYALAASIAMFTVAIVSVSVDSCVLGLCLGLSSHHVMMISLLIGYDHRPSFFNVIPSPEPGVFRLPSVRSRSPTYNFPSASSISSPISSSSSFLYRPSIDYTSNGERNVSASSSMLPRDPSPDDSQTDGPTESDQSV